MNPSTLCSRIFSRLQIATGLQDYLESRAAGGAILCYHGVLRRQTDPELERYTIDGATLDGHLRFLRRKYEPVPLSQIVEALRDGRPVPPRWVAVTLDDALENQVTLGAEILAEHNIPWSLAVPAGLIGTNRSIWSYELSLLLRHWESSDLPEPGDSSARLPLSSPGDRGAALERVRKTLLAQSAGSLALRYVDALIAEFGRERFLERLHEDGRFRLASWEQLRQIRSQGVELLSHGWSHLPQNDGLSDDEMNREVAGSRNVLDQMTGVSPLGFVFPHGYLRSDSCSAIQAAGYAFGLTMQAGRVLNSSGCHELPRYNGEHRLSILRRHLLTASNPSAQTHTAPLHAARASQQAMSQGAAASGAGSASS